MPEQLKTILIVTAVLLILALLWAVSIALTYWDASARRKLRGLELAAWLALVILVPGIGFIGYLFSRLLGNVVAPNSKGPENPPRMTRVRKPAEIMPSGGTIAAADLPQAGATEAELPAGEIAPGLPAHKYRISVVAGADSGKEFILKLLPVTIGRGAEVSIPLDGDRAVSRQQAEFYEQAGQLRVRDLHSSHGTKVNGQRADDEPLEPGDQVQVGTTILLVGVVEDAE